MKWMFAFCLFCVSASLLGGEVLNVGLVYDGPGLEDFRYFKVIREEIQDLLSEEFEVNFVNYEGQWTTETIGTAYRSALEDPEIDAIITLGILASKEVVLEDVYPKPIAIPYILSLDVQRFLHLDKEKLPKNLLFLLGKKSYEDHISILNNMKDFKSIALIGDETFVGDDFKFFTKGYTKVLADAGISYYFISVTDDPQKVIHALEKRPVDAVFLYPTWRLSEAQFKHMIEAITDMGIASFSYYGEDEVKQGVLLTMTPKSHLRRTARRIALNLQELLSKSALGETDLDFDTNTDLIVNKDTAKKLNVEFSWDQIGLARFVGGSEEGMKELNLLKTGQIALCCNQDLETEYYNVMSKRQDVFLARSEMRPQVLGYAGWRAIDADRARTTFGIEPQYQGRTSLLATQSIYNDRLRTQYCVSKNHYAASQYNKRSLELDIIYEAAMHYILILRQNAAVKIAYENLMLTKANLRRANERELAGESSKAEVYRWESEMATNHDQLIVLKADLESLEASFNRILNRPIDAAVEVEDLSVENPNSYFFETDYAHSFKLLQEFFLSQAIQNSPEIKALEEQIEAHCRIYQTAKRAHYTPRVDVEGEVGRVYRGGAGKKVLIGHRDDVEMAVRVNASVPLYTGGGIRSEQNKACMEMKKLMSEKQATVQRITENVVSGIDKLRARYYSIALAKKAEDNSNKNLAIVLDLYARGLVSIVDLIDAQNSSHVAKLSKVNTEYDFINQLIHLQRVSGNFVFMLDLQDKLKMEETLSSRIHHAQL